VPPLCRRESRISYFDLDPADADEEEEGGLEFGLSCVVVVRVVVIIVQPPSRREWEERRLRTCHCACRH